MTRPLECPCGGASPDNSIKRAPDYAECCGRFIEDVESASVPATAMELMRSRYTAYVLGNTAYLRATWADATCPEDLEASANSNTRWLGLQIKRHVIADINHAEVEFIARYKVGGRAHRLHETSRFERDNAGRWRYIDGDLHD